MQLTDIIEHSRTLAECRNQALGTPRYEQALDAFMARCHTLLLEHSDPTRQTRRLASIHPANASWFLMQSIIVSYSNIDLSHTTAARVLCSDADVANLQQCLDDYLRRHHRGSPALNTRLYLFSQAIRAFVAIVNHRQDKAEILNLKAIVNALWDAQDECASIIREQQIFNRDVNVLLEHRFVNPDDFAEFKRKHHNTIKSAKNRAALVTLHHQISEHRSILQHMLNSVTDDADARQTVDALIHRCDNNQVYVAHLLENPQFYSYHCDSIATAMDAFDVQIADYLSLVRRAASPSLSASLGTTLFAHANSTTAAPPSTQPAQPQAESQPVSPAPAMVRWPIADTYYTLPAADIDAAIEQMHHAAPAA